MMKKRLLLIFLFFTLSIPGVYARGTYQEPEAFLAEIFSSAVPEARFIWMTGELKEKVTTLLQHPPSSLRLRYWQKGQRIAWILNEIGKEKPITVGIVVNNGKIETIRVLVFRESRGDEVREAFFTRQFSQASLQKDTQLDRHIDGISGATLSVRALTKLARLALFLSQQVTAK